MAMYEISIKIVFAFCMFYNRNFDKKRGNIRNYILNHCCPVKDLI